MSTNFIAKKFIWQLCNEIVENLDLNKKNGDFLNFKQKIQCFHHYIRDRTFKHKYQYFHINLRYFLENIYL